MKIFYSILLSLIVLFSNIGFTVSTHFCGGKAVKSSMSIGKDQVSCGMEKVKENQCDLPTLKSKNCCQDEFVTISTSEQNTSFSWTFDFPPIVCGSFTNEYHFYKAGLEDVVIVTNFPNPPPIPSRHRYILHQSFLI